MDLGGSPKQCSHRHNGDSSSSPTQAKRDAFVISLAAMETIPQTWVG